MRRWLLALLLFNGLTAVAGGLYLMIGRSVPPLGWLSQTSFSSYYLPGVILFAVVGGSALIAAAAVAWRLVGAALMALAAGVIMLFWIVGEVVSIRQFHWLQAVYLVTGAVAVWLAKSLQEPR